MNPPGTALGDPPARRHGVLRAVRPVAAFAGLLLAALLLCEALGWPFLRGPVERAAARATASPVRIEAPFRVRFVFGPHVQAARIVVGAAHGLELPHFVDAREVRVDWLWSDIRRWRDGAPLRLEALRAHALDARLQRLADGRASWQLGQPAAPPAGDAALPRFGLLVLDQGHVEIDDRLLALRATVDLSGSEGEGGRGIEARARGQYRGHALDLRAQTAAALPLLDESEQAPALPVRLEGQVGEVVLAFDGRAAALLTGRRLDGALRLKGPSLAAVGSPLGLALPATPPFELVGRLAHDAGVWHLVAERAAVGSSRLAGDFRYDGTREPGRLSGQLGGERLALADLGPAVGAAGAPARPAPADAPPRRVLPQREFNLPQLRGMDADVQVAVGELDFGTEALAPVRQLRTRVRLDDAVLRLDALSGVIGGGRVEGWSALDARQTPAHWSLDLSFERVDVARWIPALRRGGGGDDARQALLTGILEGRLVLAGRGRSTAQILGSADGDGRLMLRRGTVSHLLTEAAGLDLAQALGVLVRGDEPLPLRCARLEFGVRDGLVVPRVAVIDNRDSTVLVDGRASLADETLALRAQVRPKDFSPLSLRTPVLIGGHFSRPEVGVQAGRLAGRAAAAIVLGVLAAPVAALLPFVDPGSGEKSDPCTAQPKPAPGR
ncbi:AsmA family protein [Rubrivivax gelatinosus]|uniref:AsmA family protein n=1 Tax=Rubrivivax gelatinosus TaxID=28068 RepID=UPI0018CB06CB|nr:AsmA family protein [Rubrivivax gelatinosus]